MSADKVFSVPELADMILSLYRDDSESPSGPDNFVALQTVNKQWRNLIWDIMWRNPPRGGLRQILAQLGDYDLTWDEVRVRDDILSPSPASWIRLQDTHFQRITTLDLDFFTIRPLNIVSTIAESCPQLHLPRLTTLRASTDITQEQLTVVQRFMQPTVTTFDFIVWGHKEDVRFPRRYQYPLNEFERLAMEDRSSGRSGAESFPDFPEVCSEIPSKMPLIAHLRFVINDVEAFLWTGKSLPAMMIHNLERLETLELSTYGTEPFFLEAISTHCTLRTITTSQQSWPLRCLRVDRKDAFLDVAEDAIYGEEAFEPELEFPPIVPSLLEEHAFEYLTTLQLTTSVFQLSEALQRWPAHVLSNLQRFDIDTSLFNVRLGDDPRELMQLIAARFPVLKAFSIGLLYSTTGHRDRKNRFGEWLIEQIQVDADLLRPLTAVTRLTSLEVRANRSSCISVHDWPALLKFWPHLEVLVLDNTPRTYSVKGSGLKPGDAPLDQVLKTFHDYCPKLRVLSLHVDGTLALGNATPSLPVPTSLQALELVLPCLVPQDDITEDERTSESGRAETGPSDVAPAEQLPSNRIQTPSSEPKHLDRERMFIEDASRTDCLAEYLHAVLPPGCGLHVMDQGDFGLCDTLPGAKIEGEDDESQWHDVLYEWSVLHEVEGKQCRAQRCTETRGDILVPAYVVPVRDSKA